MKILFVIIAILFIIGCSGEVSNDGGRCINKICIEGHLYYVYDGAYAGGIAPKLDDNGKPCHCK